MADIEEVPRLTDSSGEDVSEPELPEDEGGKDHTSGNVELVIIRNWRRPNSLPSPSFNLLV